MAVLRRAGGGLSPADRGTWVTCMLQQIQRPVVVALLVSALFYLAYITQAAGRGAIGNRRSYTTPEGGGLRETSSALGSGSAERSPTLPQQVAAGRTITQGDDDSGDAATKPVAACPPASAAPPPQPPRDLSVAEAWRIVLEELQQQQQPPEPDGAAGQADIGAGGGASPVRASFAAYAALHARIVAGEVPPEQRKYISWEVREYTGAGLGNRLVGFVGALAMAMVTNRALVLGRDDILAPVFQPAPAPGGINWRATAAGGGSSLHYQLGLGMNAGCACEDWNDPSGPQHSMPVISVESTQYFVPCVTHNPAYRAWFQGALGDSFLFFRHALQQFVHLVPALQEELHRFTGQVLRPAAQPRRFLVGMQIREGHLIRAEHETSVFFRCARMVAAQEQAAAAGTEAASLPPPVGEAGSRAAFDAALALVGGRLGLGPGAGPTSAVAAAAAQGFEVYYFLATDSAAVRRRAQEEFGDRLLTYAPPAGGAGLPAGSDAVLDTFLLSQCDEVVVTWPKSTYGAVGAALTAHGRPPFAVQSGAKRQDECVRLLTTEPCFHGWYLRWQVPCYSKAGFETHEMLNQHNCYFCMPPDKCPGTDSADGFLITRSPLEYEALLQVSDGDYTLPEHSSPAAMRQAYAPTYADWKARVDAYAAAHTRTGS
jgi:hypothetical protein